MSLELDIAELDPFHPDRINPPDPLALFVALEGKRRELESELKAVEAEISNLSNRILEDWADRGQRNATVGKLTVFTRSEMYCSKRPEYSGQDLARVLMDLGIGQAVGYNAASLKSYIKERLGTANGDGDDIPTDTDLDAVLPPELAAMITVGENVRLRTRIAK